MKILIAPDKFKDAVTAEQAAAALAQGVRAALPAAVINECPLGDGGEGTGAILANALDADERTTAVLDPLSRERTARWWFADTAGLAIVEMAEASGLALLKPDERHALRTTSYGTGQLLAAARDVGCTRILLCVGGSATVDGGVGCLQALGWEFDDLNGARMTKPLCGADLSRIGAVRGPTDTPSIEVLYDVDNPLLGERGAATVFGPQKGADSADVAQLEVGLAQWARVMSEQSGSDVAALAGSGAAGGLPAGLEVLAGARIRSGFEVVAEHVHLPAALAECDLCLTGEGRLDDQTASGKVVAGVARLATEVDTPVWAFVGAIATRSDRTIEDLRQALGLARVVTISPSDESLEIALRKTVSNLTAAAQSTLESLR